jgi:choice-of-anchor C domain-containing protein
MKTARFVLSAAVLALASAGASAELVTNGTFESYTGPGFAGDFSTLNAGSTALTGWTIGGISVDVIQNQYGVINGYSIDMLGTPGPGYLSQALATSVGQQYVLSFDLGANGGGGTSDYQVDVGLTGVAGSSYVGVNTVAHNTFAFTATSSSTVLSFYSSGSGNSGAVLDNVSVAAVPEPETYAMLLAGLGLMGFVAQRRKAIQG